MGLGGTSRGASLCIVILLFVAPHCFTHTLEANLSALLTIDASPQSGHIIPETLFGIFFEEINHAGAGGIWAELVNNRGFEAGGPNTPSNIDPWTIIGNESSIYVSTDRTSCFSRNEVALKMKVFCGDGESVACPDGVGIYNPGFWGMNIEEKKTYNLILYVKSLDMINITVSLTSSDGLRKLASANIIADATDVSNWTRVELQLEAMATDRNARLQLTTMKKGIIWFDQISLMPLDTYKGHGFRKELISMIEDLKPQFIRFPGGCFVEGEWLRNAFRWRETIGPWEERPGHFGDVWMYWTDDGLGYLEFLQLAEDIGAAPIWVFNNGISHQDQVDTTNIFPFVQDVLDSIEFARGSPDSKWGSLRAEMGHPEPFQLEYVAVGNEDCWKKNYKGNYLKFYYAIKAAYPDIKIISNCDGSSSPLDHPADFYDFHVYTSASSLFMMNNQFDRTSRIGPKAFVSEYAVTGSDAGNGSLLASLGEAAFLIGVERNSDVVSMASYAPLFVNTNDRRWNPDAIVFNSWQQYGTPSYWMQHFFRESSGATFHPSTIQANFSGSLVASTITWKDPTDNQNYLKIKVINFGKVSVSLKISINGLEAAINSFGSATILTSDNLMDENSFAYPNKVVPVSSVLPNAGRAMDVVIAPQSLTAFDLPLTSAKLRSAI
ncbi:alpha-L-arabinofuranosidase 1-like [Zingiber officinale]|uniref:alpha-L-arabinofuranosidase 1-like n=1 Tax=Zingiber officinale TaxID=94328 RepID=UPI001C4A788B|nr:alpha-L-arabinofuranosidase 1-like [Zingiber officinale]XP_042424853.1 alpha-L-arabinofuranosidase 1-like [Zingiber officinale]